MALSLACCLMRSSGKWQGFQSMYFSVGKEGNWGSSKATEKSLIWGLVLKFHRFKSLRLQLAKVGFDHMRDQGSTSVPQTSQVWPRLGRTDSGLAATFGGLLHPFFATRFRFSVVYISPLPAPRR